MTAPSVRGWLVALIAALVVAVPPYPAAAVERVFSRGLFPLLQAGLTGVSNLAPFAWIDVWLLGLTALVVWRVIRLVAVSRRSGVASALWEGSRRLIRGLSAGVVLFMLLWGFNYRRVPLDEALGGPAPAPTVQDLVGVVTEANREAAVLRPAASAADLGYPQIVERLRQPFEAALQELGRAPLRTPGRPKVSLILTPYFTRAGIDGMIDPFALESIVHPDLLPFERPFVLAHEWGHLAGDADEAEASAVGWLACRRGDAPLRYSAAFYLIVEAGSALPRRKWSDLSPTLDPGVRADLAALSLRLQRQQPIVRRAAFRVYDQYLRANRVEDGVASYSRALSLILRIQRGVGGVSPTNSGTGNSRRP